ncbi:MAG: MarR family transcriptional regulator [Candidatus Aenigmatarchaeota archaeon]|nr:MarR family transcriptional regulator [Candidatus Aenigmarchaeota archaeon]
MMLLRKEILINILVILFVASVGNCSKIDNIRINIDLTEDNLAIFNVTINYLEDVEMSDFYTLAKIENIHVFKGNEEINCSLEELPLGTSIVCKNIFAKNITYTFSATNLIESGKRLHIFSYQFPITTLMNRLEILIKIPLGAVIADEASLEYTGLKPFYPENGVKGSDGRRIFVEWNFENPRLGEAIRVSAIYEKILKEEDNISLIYLTTIIIVVFSFAIIFLIISRKRKDISKVLPILNDAERVIMEVILESPEVLDQRKIVRATGFSKAKVSRVLKDLEERGLIKREKVGRATKVKLTFGKEEKDEEKVI